MSLVPLTNLRSAAPHITLTNDGQSLLIRRPRAATNLYGLYERDPEQYAEVMQGISVPLTRTAARQKLRLLLEEKRIDQGAFDLATACVEMQHSYGNPRIKDEVRGLLLEYWVYRCLQDKAGHGVYYSCYVSIDDWHSQNRGGAKSVDVGVWRGSSYMPGLCAEVKVGIAFTHDQPDLLREIGTRSNYALIPLLCTMLPRGHVRRRAATDGIDLTNIVVMDVNDVMSRAFCSHIS